MKKKLLHLIIALFLVNTTYSQIAEDLKEYFNDGEYFIAYGDYREALYNYLNILKKGVNNANIQYRIGLCYINLDGEKTKAIPYLLEASKSVTLEYDEGNPSEIQAPIDALFYLGVAYHVNNEFDNAINYYRKYLAILPKDDFLSEEYTKQQIAACQYAKEQIKNPKDYEIELMSNRINNASPNIRPAISGNDSVIVFMSKLKFYDGVFICKRMGDKWSFPKNINQEIMSDGDLYVSSVSYSGDKIILVKDDKFNSDLYYSTYSDDEKKWMPFEDFRRSINTKYWESHASLSRDGKTIYFVSNRNDGQGGMDIYMATLNKKDKWDDVVNLGSNINTKYNEDTPFITADGKKLFFSSQGNKENMGGYDIFYSVKAGNTWSKPVNIGYPVNTADDDLFFVPSGDGKYGYYSKINSQKPQMKQDIYRVKLK